MGGHSHPHRQCIYLYGAHYVVAWLAAGHLIWLLVSWRAEPSFCVGEELQIEEVLGMYIWFGFDYHSE